MDSTPEARISSFEAYIMYFLSHFVGWTQLDAQTYCENQPGGLITHEIFLKTRQLARKVHNKFCNLMMVLIFYYGSSNIFVLCLSWLMWD